MQASKLTQMKKHLRPGRVYRTEELAQWSSSVDRHLKELTEDGTLQKLRNGLYYCPRRFAFGEAPADEHELVRAFEDRSLCCDFAKCVQPAWIGNHAALQQARGL